MTAAFEEVTGGEQGRGRGSKDDDMEFGQQMQLQYDALDLFDYGDASPPLPLLLPHAKPLHLCNIEDDVSGGGNVAMGPMYRG